MSLVFGCAIKGNLGQVSRKPVARHPASLSAANLRKRFLVQNAEGREFNAPSAFATKTLEVVFISVWHNLLLCKPQSRRPKMQRKFLSSSSRSARKGCLPINLLRCLIKLLKWNLQLSPAIDSAVLSRYPTEWRRLLCICMHAHCFRKTLACIVRNYACKVNVNGFET